MIPRRNKMIGYNTQFGECIVGDSIELIKSIDDNSVNLVMTSPPFALLRQRVRSYPRILNISIFSIINSGKTRISIAY